MITNELITPAPLTSAYALCASATSCPERAGSAAPGAGAPATTVVYSSSACRSWFTRRGRPAGRGGTFRGVLHVKSQPVLPV
jgi:hypothetical protein